MFADGAPSPRVRRIRIIRLLLHLSLFLFSLSLLSVAASVLAYSIRVYYGSYLHAIPELLGSGGLTAVIVALAWIPRGGGEYGIRWMASVGGEVAWTTFVCLLTFGSVTSLHQSTPGLLSHCGPYFICSGYIGIFVLGWLCWLSSAMCLGLLLSSALYQRFQRHRRGQVWHKNVTREWDFFWPNEAFTSPPSHQQNHSDGSSQLVEPNARFANVDLVGNEVDRGQKSRNSSPVQVLMTPRSPYAPNDRYDFALPPENLAPGFIPPHSSSPQRPHFKFQNEKF